MALRHALAFVSLTAFAILLAPAAAAAQGEGCGQPVLVEDPAGDQSIHPLVPAPEAVRHSEMDVLATSVALDGADVVLSATLGARPLQEGSFSYRYWFGFHVKPAGGDAEYMDVRMHGKADLEGAPLITSNERGLERIAQLAPDWQGTTATFRFPLALLHEVYGTTGLEVGQPEASTDGPFAQELLMWFPTGVVYQTDDAPDGFGTWQAFEPCPAQAPAATPPAGPAADDLGNGTQALVGSAPASGEAGPAIPQDVPGFGFVGLASVLAVALVAVATRRR